MGEILALRHVAFEHLGSLAPLAHASGHRIHYLEVGVDDLRAVDASRPDLLVVLGGPIGVNDRDRYPYLDDELELISARLRHEGPMLGICLGAQLIAHALGARVYAGAHKEIGWGRLSLSDAGRASCLAALEEQSTAVLHWHGDSFDLPAGATLLASNEHYAQQAFAVGNVLALQFHIEALSAEMERWLIGHSTEIAATPGVAVENLRRESQRLGAGLERAAAEVFRSWFDEIGL